MKSNIVKGQMGVIFHISGEEYKKPKVISNKSNSTNNEINISSYDGPFIDGPIPPKEIWNKWWLSNRRDKLFFTDFADWKEKNMWPEVEDNLNRLKYKYEPWEEIQKVPSKGGGYTGGYYDAYTHTVHLPNTIKPHSGYEIEWSKFPSIYVHETAHGAFLNPSQSIQIEGLLDPKYNDLYWDMPTEINSRLMEVRFKNGFNPNHVFTTDEIEELKQNKNLFDNNIFNRYDTETLVKLLNEVASNNKYKLNPNLSKNGGIIAQQGSMIPSKKESPKPLVPVKQVQKSTQPVPLQPKPTFEEKLKSIILRMKQTTQRPKAIGVYSFGYKQPTKVVENGGNMS